MSFRRFWLGWDRPFLHAVADALMAAAPDSVRDHGLHAVDLGDRVVVLPGKRAGRRLEELLLERAEASGRALVPPRFLSPAELVDALCVPHDALASPLVATLAMAVALRQLSAPPDSPLAGLVARPPRDEDMMGWIALGARMLTLRSAVAASGHGFATDRWPQAAQALLNVGTERARWQVVAQIMAAYERWLADRGWSDRAMAIQLGLGEGALDSPAPTIVLAGLTDLHQAARRLSRLASEGDLADVHVLVRAPAELAEAGAFDRDGGVVPGWWAESTLAMGSEGDVRLADGPSDQAEAISQAMASFDGDPETSDMALGVADPRLVDLVRQHLGDLGVATRFAGGTPLDGTPPLVLLHQAARYVAGRPFDAFAALVRHPDVLRAMDLPDPNEMLGRLDGFATWHVPARVPAPGSSVGMEDGTRSSKRRSLDTLVGRLHGLLGEGLLGSRSVTIAEAAEATRAALVAVYGGRHFDQSIPSDRTRLSVLDGLRQGLDDVADLPADLVGEMGRRSVGEQLDILLGIFADGAVAEPADGSAVEITNWLDLAMEDAPYLVVSGLEEGRIPEGVTGDPILPDSLREALGIAHNALRFARDAHALRALVEERRHRGGLKVVVGRRSVDGDPAMPSRLLFMEPDDAVTLARAKRLFDSKTAPAPSIPPMLRGTRAGDGVAPPVPDPGAGATIQSLSVTAFKDYLACPYRFWLKHIVRLRAVEDSDVELDAAGFGALVHGVLEDFGKHPEIRDSEDALAICEAFDQLLAVRASARFGPSARRAVHVQVELARRRLHAFAPHQARRAAEGWRILHSEYKVGKEDHAAALPMDGETMYVHGRIDRIDHHPDHDTLAIWDYKTGSRGPKPDHFSRKHGWTSLQLPLYRHLLAALGGDWKGVEVGYARLPAETKDCGFARADWIPEELADADEVACSVARDVRAGRFWPPRPPPKFPDGLAWICQEDALNAWPPDDST